MTCRGESGVVGKAGDEHSWVYKPNGGEEWRGQKEGTGDGWGELVY